MKRAALLLAALTLALTGCAARVRPPDHGQSRPDASVQEHTPDLMSYTRWDEIARLTPNELAAGLRRHIRGAAEPVPQRLAALFDRWRLQPGEDSILFAEADLNGDGTPEFVTDLKGSGWVREHGAIFVIHRTDRGYEVDGSRPCVRGSAALHAVADPTGDGRPDIIWSCTDLAAHSPLSRVFASNWEPGRVRELPGDLSIRKMQLEVQYDQLVLHRGLIGSPGAGMAQRTRTDRYRFVDGAFRLVDRSYEPSEDGYHRLQDAIVAEGLGRREDAQRAYRDAMRPDRVALQASRYQPDGTDPAGMRERFGEAVRAFARFRLAALLMQDRDFAEARRAAQQAGGPYAGLPRTLSNVSDRESGCEAAARWAQSNPDFLDVLNSPFGYANPKWRPEDLCGPLPIPE